MLMQRVEVLAGFAHAGSGAADGMKMVRLELELPWKARMMRHTPMPSSATDTSTLSTTSARFEPRMAGAYPGPCAGKSRAELGGSAGVHAAPKLLID